MLPMAARPGLKDRRLRTVPQSEDRQMVMQSCQIWVGSFVFSFCNVLLIFTKRMRGKNQGVVIGLGFFLRGGVNSCEQLYYFTFQFNVLEFF